MFKTSGVKNHYKSLGASALLLQAECQQTAGLAEMMWSLNHGGVFHCQVEVLPLEPKNKVLSILHVQANRHLMLNGLIKCSA